MASRSDSMRPEEISWVICDLAQPTTKLLKERLGDSRYDMVRTSLKGFICEYFDAAPSCNSKQGKSIRPIRCSIPNAKGLKVRFGYPGCGKSGGLRLAVLALCDQRLVKIAGAWIRREDPDETAFAAAFEAS